MEKHSITKEDAARKDSSKRVSTGDIYLGELHNCPSFFWLPKSNLTKSSGNDHVSSTLIQNKQSSWETNI